MDNLSEELEAFLIRLGKDEQCAGARVADYMQRIINLLYSSDAEIVEQRYGLFGAKQLSVGELAAKYKTTPEAITTGISACLRKIAVSPEWQEIKPFTHLRAIRLK